ncbi:acetyl-CoA carboxylase biotin carboxyl carrier protein subunit [Desulfosporosinus sp. BICA1-9]|uniref:acetyl-CoA carboxylase biotin carboxyl carrier protein subunit n=1 Tax=Desulfosporosinus sp. BICA1-9 TaxID=1531958 RepID=UPI00054B0FCA|nr:acetyl-CoA carboxylase biotin carboxyl carrier protein subunit [Desulfosporosinus sp. BICA1-9]KJS48271.1 MAG: acetyl-CoA carboxylase [Peptococcaceae bacterium BRH_c23]KJS88855.1 MAG: acetyl-CoA carboxylase [Desulfosporosinus sp. BICA1-9]HBW37283.1 acetyl-CoA carboxylase biotin carboxyl carrier protein subunit [Desulfosporosinus sp.]
MANLLSPISGNVWKIHVAVGDVVEIDDELVILEALKMETPIYASDAGTVTELKVKEGESVSEDQVLIVIE